MNVGIEQFFIDGLWQKPRLTVERERKCLNEHVHTTMREKIYHTREDEKKNTQPQQQQQQQP